MFQSEVTRSTPTQRDLPFMECLLSVWQGVSGLRPKYSSKFPSVLGVCRLAATVGHWQWPMHPTPTLHHSLRNSLPASSKKVWRLPVPKGCVPQLAIQSPKRPHELAQQGPKRGPTDQSGFNSFSRIDHESHMISQESK